MSPHEPYAGVAGLGTAFRAGSAAPLAVAEPAALQLAKPANHDLLSAAPAVEGAPGVSARPASGFRHGPPWT